MMPRSFLSQSLSVWGIEGVAVREGVGCLGGGPLRYGPHLGTPS